MAKAEQTQDKMVAINEMISAKMVRAKKASEIMSKMSQEQVNKICEAMCSVGEANAIRLAEMAVSETGVGNVEHKTIKNVFSSRGAYEYMKDKISVGKMSEEDGITCIAEPFGIIAALIPVTNPGCTVLYKTMISLKTRNVVVLSFHPRAKETSVTAAKLVLDAAISQGAPSDCIQWLEHPSIAASDALMKHPDISLIIATGGSAMVKAAYSSGHPAMGVGPGNVPAYIDKSADLDQAIRDIVLSKTFDYGCACTAESTVIFDNKDTAENALRIFKEKGAYLCTSKEKAKLENIMFDKENRTVKGQIVGQSPQKISEMAGFSIPDTSKYIMVQIDATGSNDWFNFEKLSPVLGWYVAENSDKAIQAVVEQLEFCGAGHNAVIHSRNEDLVERYALEVPSTKVIWNQPSMFGVSGFTSAMPPSIILGCGARGGNSITEGLTYKHLINVKRLIKRTKENP